MRCLPIRCSFMYRERRRSLPCKGRARMDWHSRAHLRVRAERDESNQSRAEERACPAECLMKILIADDHSIVRRGLQQILATRRDWTVSAEVGSADDVLPALRAQPIDVVVLDVSLRGRSGIELLGQIR